LRGARGGGPGNEKQDERDNRKPACGIHSFSRVLCGACRSDSGHGGRVERGARSR
jgi:hypothetical protein